MAEKYEITDVPRISKIKTLSAIKKWQPAPDRLFFFLDIDFENGDSVKLMDGDYPKLMSYCVGKRYYYELIRTTNIDDEGKAKTTCTFKYIQEIISDQFKARLSRVDQTFEYIKLSAQLAISSIGAGEWEDSKFKDIYRVIFDTMKTTLHNEDFGEYEGDDLDSFMKKNALDL